MEMSKLSAQRNFRSAKKIADLYLKLFWNRNIFHWTQSCEAFVTLLSNSTIGKDKKSDFLVLGTDLRREK
jgi:hypothetical protein